MIRYNKLGFIQDRRLLLTLVSFYYHRDFGRMLLSDKWDVFYSLFEGATLLEGVFQWHGAGGLGGTVRQTVLAASGGSGSILSLFFLFP